MTTRRELLLALGAVPLTSLPSLAQSQARVWRIGFLSTRRPASIDTDVFGGFPRGMRELGYVEGKNLVTEWRFTDGEHGRLAGLAAELIQLKVDVIVANATPAAIAAQKTTTTIPIVVGNAGDPVGSGLVKTLARPGGNVTGLTNISAELTGKYLQTIVRMVPRLTRTGFLVNPGNATHAFSLKYILAAGEKAGVKVVPVEARTAQDIGNAFSTMARQNVGAVVVNLDSLFFQERAQITELVAKYRLPSMFGREEFVELGGLMSYGANFTEMFRRAAHLVDKILKGAKPADLPVEQPTKFELFINRKTAKALGLTIPQSLLLGADEVIQ